MLHKNSIGGQEKFFLNNGLEIWVWIVAMQWALDFVDQGPRNNVGMGLGIHPALKRRGLSRTGSARVMAADQFKDEEAAVQCTVKDGDPALWFEPHVGR